MKIVNGKKVSNAEYKRNQAAYHNVEYDFMKMQDEAAEKLAEHNRRHPEVVGTSKDWVETYKEPSIIISMGDPGESKPRYAVDHIDVLRLEFDDVDQEMGDEYTLFDYQHARRILDYLKKHEGKPIVVHCAAGISRSAAVVKFMVDKLGYTRSERPSNTVKEDYYNGWVYRQLEICHVDRKLS